MSSATTVNSLTMSSMLPEPDLVVIDLDLESYGFWIQNLVQAIALPAAVLMLSQGQNGVTAITQRLASLPPIRRLHLVTARRADSLPLGNVVLHHGNLPEHASALYQWRRYLAPRAEILIYNDQATRTETGKLLIDVLHHLTGAAIAACTTLPHPNAPDGQWDLDCATQSFQPVLAFPPAVMAKLWSSQPPPNFCKERFTLSASAIPYKRHRFKRQGQRVRILGWQGLPSTRKVTTQAPVQTT